MINHIGSQPITTDRLTLRRFTADDSKDAFEKWTSSYDSRFWYPPHESIEETEQEINEYVKNYYNADWYMWAVVFEDELIGLVCGNEINEDIRSICIGYCITKSCWNRGIATEASKALINYFFDIGFNRVFSHHNPLNPSSGRVMQKCGMTFEGKIRGGSMFAGEICDCLQYSILKEDITG
ncbi:MAG: GNAT family N-acetyltransferase [Oscillospiraceae bacterium]|nr:GNAT family N-acetyltransferase [Oscillospiraceae bacterium]